MIFLRHFSFRFFISRRFSFFDFHDIFFFDSHSFHGFLRSGIVRRPPLSDGLSGSSSSALAQRRGGAARHA
jgi:hypothetical protein